MTLLDRVRHGSARHQLLPRGVRVAAAVSGGSDSVALAHLLRELDQAGELRLVALAHFNHQLRPSAGGDERLVSGLAHALGCPAAIEREDVAERARRERCSIEAAAHAARYAFYERVRVAAGADVVALGHTRDDQAETFLLRLLRGAGPRGLAGMHPRHGAIVRPLLTCRRAELREYLVARGAAWAEDETNADVQIPRNRIRAELVPVLERRFNPQIVEALSAEAELSRELWEWMEGAAEAYRARGERLELDIASLASAPAALRRLVLWQTMNDVSGGRNVSFDHVEAAWTLAAGEPGRSLDLPGHRVERRATVLAFGPAPARGAAPADVGFDCPLPVPGEVALPSAQCVVAAEPAEGSAVPGGPADRAVAVVRRDLCGGALRVRSRRPGDRFRPFGLAGRKKLQDFFVDRKVARERRDMVPLVVDHQDRIVWVAGYEIAEEFRVTDPAQAVLILRLKLVGGPA